MTLKGRRLSLKNWLKSVISLISLKSGDFIILVHQTVEGSLLKSVARNHWKSVHLTLNGTAFGWKNWYFSPKVSLLISSKKSLENLSICKVLVKALFQRNCLKSVHLSYFLRSADFTEICNFTEICSFCSFFLK